MITGPCMGCGNAKTTKVEFRGKPLCAEWRPCAARIRKNYKRGIRPAAQAA